MVIVPSSARRGPVAHLEDVGDGVLREPADARSDEENQRDADPCPRRLPQRGDPDTIAEPGAPEQAARANPGREQREHEHVRRQRPAGDQEVVAAPGARVPRLATPRPPRAPRDSREPRTGRDTCGDRTTAVPRAVPRATCDVRRATCSTCHVRRATCTCRVRRAACDVPRAMSNVLSANTCHVRPAPTTRGMAQHAARRTSHSA